MKRLVAALGIVLTACNPTGPAPEPSPSPTPTIAPGFDDLARVLFDEPPPGFVTVAEETRGLALEDVIAGVDDPDAERLRLETHGFKRGFIRTWSSDDDSENVVYAFVYEFDSAAGAAADAKAGIDEAKREGDAFFDVPGVAGATGITRKPKPGAEDEDATFHAVVFVRGNRYFLVAIGGPTEHSPEAATALAVKMNEAASR